MYRTQNRVCFGQISGVPRRRQTRIRIRTRHFVLSDFAVACWVRMKLLQVPDTTVNPIREPPFVLGLSLVELRVRLLFTCWVVLRGPGRTTWERAPLALWVYLACGSVSDAGYAVSSRRLACAALKLLFFRYRVSLIYYSHSKKVSSDL